MGPPDNSPHLCASARARVARGRLQRGWPTVTGQVQRRRGIAPPPTPRTCCASLTTRRLPLQSSSWSRASSRHAVWSGFMSKGTAREHTRVREVPSCPATVHGVCAPAPRGRSRTRTWSFALSRSPLLQMARSSSKTCLSGTKPACARAFRCLRRWAVRIHNFDSVCSMRRRHVFTGRVVMHQLRRWNVFAVRIHNFDSLCSRTAGTYSLAWSSCTNCGLSLLKKRSGSLPQPARVIYEVLLAFEDSGGQACAHGVSVCAASTPPTESGCRTRLSTWTA